MAQKDTMTREKITLSHRAPEALGKDLTQVFTGSFSSAGSVLKRLLTSLTSSASFFGRRTTPTSRFESFLFKSAAILRGARRMPLSSRN